jgi:hypothetical protein
MLLIKETQGDTLGGIIDGTNVTYTTSLTMAVEFVNVYINGVMKVASLQDGYTVTGLNTVVLNEPLVPGDTLEIEYRSKTFTGGGAPGGAPAQPSAQVLIPSISASILPDYDT